MSLGRKIFVIHGRDKRARHEVFIYLRSIGLHPIEWTETLAETGGGAPPISDILDKAIRPDRAFLVLLTPDDTTQLKDEHADDGDDPETLPGGQARPNVLFEAGMAFGRCPDSTVLVEFGKVRRFSDAAGRFIVKLDDSTQSRHKLALRLKAIGCDVDLGGTDWQTAGDLTPPSGQRATPARRPAQTPLRESVSAPRELGTETPEFTKSSGTRNLDLHNFSTRLRRGKPVVDGEITNNEPHALMVALKATFYDVAGRILGSANDVVNELGTGDPTAFELCAFEDIGPFTRVHVRVESAVEL